MDRLQRRASTCCASFLVNRPLPCAGCTQCERDASRQHGIRASRHGWRPWVTPKPPARHARLKKQACEDTTAAEPAPAKKRRVAPVAVVTVVCGLARPDSEGARARPDAHHSPTLPAPLRRRTPRHVVTRRLAAAPAPHIRLRCAPMTERRTEDARAFHDHRLSDGAPHPPSSELALAAPNGSTRARSNVATDDVRARRGVGGHPARARHGARTSRSSSQRCAQCTTRGPCDGPSGCLMRERRLARRRPRGACHGREFYGFLSALSSRLPVP